MEGVPCPVDDRLQQLVPRSGGGRETGYVMDEPELVELVGRRGRQWPRVGVVGGGTVGHVHHMTRVGTVPASKGCGTVAAWLRYVSERGGL
jgi:hypothetical protein